MVVNKAFTYALLAVITLVPWNATAVNSFGVDKLFLNNGNQKAIKNLLAPNAIQKNVSNSLDASMSAASALSNELGNKFAETMLVKSLLEITRGQNQQALETINELLQVIPNFKLAHLVRGDLLTAQARYLQSFGNAESHPAAPAVKDLQDEARMRIERYLASQSDEKIPDLLISPNKQQQHIIVVDTDKSRLYVYKNQQGKLSYLNDFYVTVGKNGLEKQTEGDKRTPLGVYFTRPKLTQPLPDLYGDGAYPLNYPNEWDRTNNRKGSGIWLHGTPSDTFSRPPRASDGCVVLTNQDLKSLEPVLYSGKTPVIIAKNLHWLTDNTSDSKSASASEKDALNVAIQTWLNDWRVQNTAQYLSHYSRDFSSNGINYQQWAEHKYRVQASKPNININISNISMFAYPDPSKKLVVVDFTQDFKSAHLSNLMQKRQYWLLENNAWKIVYEGAA